MKGLRIARSNRPGDRWRVYPDPDTTVAELALALGAFPMTCVVDEAGAVCLQMIGDRDQGRPSAEALAQAMWGTENTATLVDESGAFQKLEI